MANRKTRRANAATTRKAPKKDKVPEGMVLCPVGVLVPIYNYLMNRPVREVEQAIVALRQVMGPEATPTAEEPQDTAPAG